jgi:5-methylcytosine-specific restriction protein A
MPLKPFKQCKQSGCRELTRDGYCETHAHVADTNKAERNKYYDKHRDKKYVDFYHSDAWEKLRLMALRRDRGLCVSCYKRNKIVSADMVHHIVEVKANWMLRLTISNLVSLCNSCHSKIPHYKD